MGKPLMQQRRGKGSVFKTPGHRFVAKVRYPNAVYASKSLGQVVELLDDPGKTAPLAVILLPGGKDFYTLAAEGVAVGDRIAVGSFAAEGSISTQVKQGSIVPLSNVPDGASVFNIELRPGDGGRVSRSGGATSFIVGRDEETGVVSVQLPSKRTITLPPECFATVGVAAGGGRLDKPFKKAGAHYHAAHARGRRYPSVRGTAMNAVDHPYGGRTGSRPTTVKRGTPPGRKAGHIAARATGRKKAHRGKEGNQ